ncbi:hypothetical protein GCM10007170_13740 [Arthrobacter liuii]|uniref:formate--tetrahydrofolate ligase n=1 Tax=Arthrobacter liuii TaxID=1476996 RepID=A0ABQ2ANJ1_9MICC|nr:formate--tetrahydrofolate ligase [Arthrobacter liuii]GGH93266.1 hypothetical protein GCM10007170_13740 [Arthrobacter liuii]
MSALPSDLEIARAARIRPIGEIAAAAGVNSDALEQYGRYKAKIDPARLTAPAPHGKVVLVSAMSPTPAGEGKSTTTVGLADSLARAGHKVMIALREPSLGPVLGMKGGATGGGYSQVLPMNEINLHFTGDFHAITSANNALMALVDNHIYQGNALNIMARQLPLGDLVAMGDELVRQPRLDFEDRDSPHSTIGELRALITRHPNLQGVVRARQALELVRVGSDSAPETFLRLAMMDSNLPAPELQLKLRPGDPRSPSADLGYGRQRIAIQYDGGHHLLEPQRISDRRRDRSFEAAGWTVVIIDKADQEDNFAAAIKKIRRALRSSLSESTVTAGFVSSC